MPRIPVRVEPYSSPSKQHRHYKSKRDQVLRSLGKAAYINGSQFALLLVSARGDVETYASDALQGHLDTWFVKSGIADEARQLAQKSHDENHSHSPTFDADEELTENIEDVCASASASSVPKATDDPFLDSWNPLPVGTPKLERNTDEWDNVLKQEIVSDDNHSLMESKADTYSPQPIALPQTSTPLHPSSNTPLPSSRTTMHTAQPGYTLELKDENARTEFIELRFSQLQQVMCKMIAKEWVKVIEPKKQTRFPYNKGDAGKPTWWPADVRHKEPDHLMKPERHALLLAILRSPQTRIARLQLATAEVIALIKAGKVTYLMDVYRVAREEERLRDEGLDPNSPITVSVSSLEGWDAANGCASRTAVGSSIRMIENTRSKEWKVERRASSRFDEDETSEMRCTMSWTPATQTSYPSNVSSTMQNFAQLPNHMSPHGMDHRTAVEMPSKLGLTTNVPQDPAIFSPSMSTDTQTQRASFHGLGVTVPHVQSPLNAVRSTPAASSENVDIPRSASVSYPVTSVPMRPAHSSPANFNQAENWMDMRYAQRAVPHMHFEHSTHHGMDMKTLPTHQQPRPPWEFQIPGTPYHQPPQASLWAPMPETPIHRSHPVMPMHMGMNTSPTHDVMVSNSFDSSFSSSHLGPVTPAQAPFVFMNGPAASYPTTKSPPVNQAMTFQDFGLSQVPSPSQDIHSVQAKQHGQYASFTSAPMDWSTR